MRRTFSFGLLAVLLLTGRLSAQTVSFESLLGEMTDRDRLARLPDPAYTCRQFSSYDRDSVAPDKPGWFANWDRSQFVRVEETAGRKEHVLMDADGPGAVVRFWATWHGPRRGKFTNGTLRVYLDSQAEPAIEGPIADLIDGGALVGPPLSEGVSPLSAYERCGHNLYLPIPYADHCKVTYETTAPIDRGAKTGEALYYQINYRTYPKGTVVESFHRDQLKQFQPELARTQQRLTRSGWGDETTETLETKSFAGPLRPGESRVVTIDGPAAVRQLVINLKADDLEQALRSTVLEIAFDGEDSVWCPVGTFFGIGYQLQACKTWYTQAMENGVLSSFWVMPFEKSCRLTLHNVGTQAIQVPLGQARYSPWSWDDRSLHFHATWKQLSSVETHGRKDMTGQGAFDVNYVEVQGQGVYVGDTLTIFNGTNAWWGEGDEKIYIDGEPFPSHIGTGTEDYYGYAWCRPTYFSSPFHSEPTGEGNLTVGFTVNSRYRALDAIPFRKSIKFDMELWHWRDTRINYAPATFWYARPNAVCNIAPDPETAAKPVARKREDVVEVFRVKGAVEGETLKVVQRTGGLSAIQDVPQFRWSDDKQLWWRDGKVGDKLVIEFPVTRSGRYHVTANLTKGRDYGIVKIRVNDGSPKEFDRYAAVVSHDKVDLGTNELSEGANRMVIEIAGANANAVKRHVFGLDYLLLVPAIAK